MTWAIGSGNIAGWAAAQACCARSARRAAERNVHPVGGAGLTGTADSFDADAIVRGVQAEIFPLDKNIFRTEAGLTESLSKLDELWQEVKQSPLQVTALQVQRSREAASLVAAARWSYFAGLERKETRGMHKRMDYPQLDPAQRHYLRGGVGGLGLSSGHAPFRCLELVDPGTRHGGYHSRVSSPPPLLSSLAQR